MGQPPMMWAVVGTSRVASKIDPNAAPPITSAAWLATSPAAGIHDGLGSPCPCSVVRCDPNGPFTRRVVSELSRLCMTSRMMPFSDHRRLLSSFRNRSGCSRIDSTNFSGRGRRPPPSTSGAVSIAMALEPLG